MNKPFVYKIIQLVIIMTLLWVVISAQENSGTILNTTKVIASLNNTNKNISIINNTIFNTSNLDSSGNDAFIISSDVKLMPMDRAGINISSKTFGVQPPKKAIFLIEGFAKPTKDEIFRNQNLFNAAYLSRKVEGTPHGYVTYYN